MSSTEQIQKNSQQLIKKIPELKASELEDLVNYHNTEYFVRNSPEISDETFDFLVESLRKLKPSSKTLEDVGNSLEPASNSNRMSHVEPMLSLDKAYDENTLKKWFEQFQGNALCMPKIDGVACAIRYNEKGILNLALTRGNGKIGEAITENVKAINDVPKLVDTSFYEMDSNKYSGIEIRGEVYLSRERFKHLYSTQFANTRNLTAGALKQKDSKLSAKYGLSFFPYDLRGVKIKDEQEKFKILEQLKFNVPKITSATSFEEASRCLSEIKLQREKYDFDTDGIVFRVNSIQEQLRLGFTAHHPRWSIAYKFQDESACSVVKSVEWSLGRTGTITPVALIEPVFVSGATISRASLHNVGWMTDLGLTMGAEVSLARRGGVIPYVEKVIRGTNEEITFPSKCPSCKEPTMLVDDFLKCSNVKECPDAIVARLQYFCSVLEIKGFGAELLSMLVARKLLHSPADLYRLRTLDLVPLERVGEKLANKLIREIDKHRELTLVQLIVAFGFEEVGPSVAETIVAQFSSIDQLRKASRQDFSSLFGVGEAIARSLEAGLVSENSNLENLLDQVKIISQSDISEGKYAGFSIVFTGKMSRLSRKEAQKQVRLLGGKTPSSVTSEVTHLVIGDEGSPLFGEGKKTTKQKQAEKLIEAGSPIKIIPESMFLKM